MHTFKFLILFNSSIGSKWSKGIVELTREGVLSLYKHGEKNKNIDLKTVEFKVYYSQLQLSNSINPDLPGWAFEKMVLHLNFTKDSFLIIFPDVSKA